MISVASSRGRRCAKFLASSCIAWFNSPTIISHILTSLSCVPKIKQVRFQALEGQTECFDVSFHFLSRGVAVFQKKGVHLAAIKRSQSLDDVVSIDDRLVIRSGKLISRSHPKLVRISKVIFCELGNALDLG